MMRRRFLNLKVLALGFLLVPFPAQEQLYGAATKGDDDVAIQLWRFRCNKVPLPFDYFVDRGVVRLSGQVNSKDERRSVVQAVKHMSGVKRVHDHIGISRTPLWGVGCGTGLGSGSGVGYGPLAVPSIKGDSHSQRTAALMLDLRS